MPMEINLTLCLPRDEMSIPLVRHICDYAMEEVGVADLCRADVLLALTEACSNVTAHSTTENEYEVTICIGQERCEIRVVDRGKGFDIDLIELGRAEPEAESGRGITLMHALVDRIAFESKPQDGTVVHLEKALVYDETNPVRMALAAAGARTEA